MKTPRKAATAMAEHRRYRIDVVDVTNPDAPYVFDPVQISARCVASAFRKASMLPTSAWAPVDDEETR